MDLPVVSIPFLGKVPDDIQVLRSRMQMLPFHRIDCVNWKAEYPYTPDVEFTAAWNAESFYILYLIREHHVKAVTSKPNGPVWEDSCCEFFFAPDNSGYYNVEVNCAGVPLLGWHGIDGAKSRASTQVIDQLRTASSLGTRVPMQVDGDIRWQLIVILPATALYSHPDYKLKEGLRLKANFYKCGDKTRIPHFLSWSPIKHPTPNFHLPQFFGEMVLAR